MSATAAAGPPSAPRPPPTVTVSPSITPIALASPGAVADKIRSRLTSMSAGAAAPAAPPPPAPPPTVTVSAAITPITPSSPGSVADKIRKRLSSTGFATPGSGDASLAAVGGAKPKTAMVGGGGRRGTTVAGAMGIAAIANIGAEAQARMEEKQKREGSRKLFGASKKKSRNKKKEHKKIRRNSLIECESGSDVVFLVGCEPDVQRIPGHSWILAENSPVFRAMFTGPLSEHAKQRNSMTNTNVIGMSGSASAAAAAAGGAGASGGKRSKKTTVAVSDVDGRAFDILLRYLYNESVQLQSVMTALTTLYAAHKYMCPGLAKVAVKYLRANLSEKNVLLVMQHICLYCTGANASNTAANQTDLSLWDASAAGAADSGPVVTTGPSRATSISHCNSAGCTGGKPSAPPPVSSAEEDAEEDEDDDDFIDEDNPLLLDQITEDEFKDFESGMAVSRYDGRGNHVRVNCCSALMKECLEVIDSEASYVLQCEDLEDLDLSALNLVVCRETLNVKSETEVFNALVRWSGRECKRQRLEMTNGNRRKVLEGCQYLVRYLTMSQEELLRTTTLLTEEEMDALMTCLHQEQQSSGGGLGSVISQLATGFLPDHLLEMQSVMRTRRKAREKEEHGIKKLSAAAKKFKDGSKGDKHDGHGGHGGNAGSSVATAAIELERQRRNLKAETQQTQKEKFNFVEEFFICLACIFD